MPDEKVNILLVDDQPARLLSYEVILQGLGENLLKAGSGSEALEQLLKTEFAVVLLDVSMPELDGFQLAEMIRDHPRYHRTAIIFISAINFSDFDRIRGYEMGAVDYVPVPVIPEVLRAKVRVFVDLYRKTRELRQLNDELDRRVRDRTAELEASIERQLFLAREVDHRAKNALAIVQSIVRLTRAADMQSYVALIEGRIKALAKAHELLSQSRWQGASLGRLIEEELAPYGSRATRKITVRGPTVSLQPLAAQTFALSVHELATNAAKYGALSLPSGRVDIQWELQANALTFAWEETGGPPLKPPAFGGFGTALIRSAVEEQLGGTVSFDWRSTGLHCAIALPRTLQLERLSETASKEAESPDEGPAPASKRVLLVEDEALVGLMMANLLRELGLVVLGPYARVAEALAAASQASIDAGVLDINLGGELVYPVADVLGSRGVPFIFVTGYGRDRIDGRYSSVPALEKPLRADDLQIALSKVEWGASNHDQAANRNSTTGAVN